MSDQLRRYELWVCPDHGQAHIRHDSCGKIVDRSATGRITRCGKGPLVSSVDERDLQPFLAAMGDAARRTIDDTTRAELELALKSFSTQSEEKQR